MNQYMCISEHTKTPNPSAASIEPCNMEEGFRV